MDLDPRSTQPFSIDDGNYVIVFNGEIYNYLSLKKELQDVYHVEFRTTSDTEVLIQLYKHYGKWCLEKLEWMFAFAIYDTRKNTVLFARDFIWQKPLVYISDNTGFYFASEIPGLLQLYPEFWVKLNIESLKFYMLENYSHLPHNFSIFENIQKLYPGHFLVVEDGKIIEHSAYEHLRKMDTSFADNEIGFLEKILDEMRPTEVWYASFLSGGIDSSFVCSVLKKYETSQTEAYTLKIGENDEDFKRSQFVVDTLNLKHHIIDIDWCDYLRSIDDSVMILGEPYFHITSVYADRILSEASKKHRVFFTGAWGDECYYGYDNLLFLIMDFYFSLHRYMPQKLISWIDRFTRRKYTSILNSNNLNFKEHYYKEKYTKVAPLFQDEKNIDEEIKSVTWSLSSFVDSLSYIDTSYMYGLFLENMHSLMIQSDLIGMKHSIEIRSLFLEKRVIKRSFSLPLSEKISIFHLREGKEILKKWLNKIFPRHFLYAKKIGFGVKFDFKKHIIETSGSIIENRVKKLAWINVFDMNEVGELFYDFRGNFHTIMKLYTIQVWREKFLS